MSYLVYAYMRARGGIGLSTLVTAKLAERRHRAVHRVAPASFARAAATSAASKGRTEILLDYHLRVGQVTHDTHVPTGQGSKSSVSTKR